jgi:hypothetical protein
MHPFSTKEQRRLIRMAHVFGLRCYLSTDPAGVFLQLSDLHGRAGECVHVTSAKELYRAAARCMRERPPVRIPIESLYL